MTFKLIFIFNSYIKMLDYAIATRIRIQINPTKQEEKMNQKY